MHVRNAGAENTREGIFARTCNISYGISKIASRFTDLIFNMNLNDVFDSGNGFTITCAI
jgi:hypothetical protein